MSPSFFSGNIANMIPEGPLNKMVPLKEDRGGGGGGGGGGARGPPLAHGLKHLMKDLPECRQIDYFIFIMFVIVISQENMRFLFICQVHVFHLRD